VSEQLIFEGSLDVLAKVGREAFFSALGQRTPEHTEATTANWGDVVHVVLPVMQMDTSVSAANLARAAYQAFGRNTAPWDTQPLVVRLAWEAVVRHIVSVSAAEDSKDLNTCTSFDWGKWVLERISKETAA